MAELRSLLRGQWSTGMIPHIVFDPTVALGAYEPRHSRWATAGLCPPDVPTSGICQPPVHALALGRVREIAAERDDGSLARVDRAIAAFYPRLADWHRWLHTARDPEGTGLVTIFHPWESGLDNSPRWDERAAAVAPDGGPEEPRPTCPTSPTRASGRPTPTTAATGRCALARRPRTTAPPPTAATRSAWRTCCSRPCSRADEVLADLAVVASHPRRPTGTGPTPPSRAGASTPAGTPTAAPPSTATWCTTAGDGRHDRRVRR